MKAINFALSLVMTLVLLVCAPAMADHDKDSSLTRINILLPFDDKKLAKTFKVSKRRKGSCWSSSLADPRPDAWRCNLKNKIYDPCFINAEKNEVVCPLSPWGKKVVVLNLMSALPASKNNKFDPLQSLPWAIELNGKQRCKMVTGTSKMLISMRVNYVCGKGSFVVGGFDRSANIWKVFYHNKHSKVLTQRKVTAVWF